VRFNPCSPIPYVTNLTEAPAGAAALVSAAINDLAAATGMTFVNQGSTTEIPSSNRPAVVPQYGSGWAPILIGWARVGESNLLPGGSTVGQGVTTSVGSAGGDAEYVTGQVVIDADGTRTLPVSFGGRTLGQLLLHELGHVAGLGHVSDPAQIMYPALVASSGNGYSAGDLAGLGLLGRKSGCLSPDQPT
jgi:hypothetical protein